jgi:hypothetical protein
MEAIYTERKARKYHTDDSALYFFCELDRDYQNEVLRLATLSQWRAFVDATKMKKIGVVAAPSPLAGRVRTTYPCYIRPGDRYRLQTVFEGGSVWQWRGRVEIWDAISNADAWEEE